MDVVDRFFNALKGKEVDRPPVTCANQTATVEQMEKVGVFWPEAHKDAEKMAVLAAQAWEQLGLEVVGVPFCQTVEAEVLGCEIKWSDKKDAIPSVPFEGYASPDDVTVPENLLEQGRIPVVFKALEILREKYGEQVPIMGHVNGPFSLASHLTDPSKMMKLILTKPDVVPEFCRISVDVISEYANAMYDHGADVVVIEDMIASVDLLGPKFYEDFSFPFEKELASRLKGPSILHICGNATSVLDNMIATGSDGISIDSKVDASLAVEKSRGKCAVLGNVDALVLLNGTVDEIQKETMKSIEANVDLVAPACAISPLNSNKNIKAMVDTVVEYGGK
jgi:[methyl-Co(III) methanol-specific corrinoid protein]:coenzyme M methyltransferase